MLTTRQALRLTYDETPNDTFTDELACALFAHIDALEERLVTLERFASAGPDLLAACEAAHAAVQGAMAATAPLQLQGDVALAEQLEAAIRKATGRDA